MYEGSGSNLCCNLICNLNLRLASTEAVQHHWVCAGLLYLGSGMVSCTSSQKQQHTSDSSCYAEYIAVHSATQSPLFSTISRWTRHAHFRCHPSIATMTRAPTQRRPACQYFRVRYHTIRELVNFKFETEGPWCLFF